MTKLRVDASIEKATPVLERYAALGGTVASVQAVRAKRLAAVNAEADAVLAPVLAEQAAIAAQLQPWWARNGAALLKGKRKTIQLGGCMIGTKAGRARLEHGYADDAIALGELRALRWTKPYVRVTYSLDKVAIADGLEGKQAAGLRELGFRMSEPGETFVLEPVTQDGTIAG